MWNVNLSQIARKECAYVTVIDKSDLTMEDLSILNQEFSRRKKSSGTMWFLWFFLGGIGAHRFYLGETVMGIV